MKLFSVLLVMLSSAAVFASPAVNDQAVFDVTATSSTASVTGSYEIKLAEFNATSNQYKVVTTITVNGQEPKVEEKWVDTDTLASDAKVQDVLTNCASYGGKTEQLAVPAGNLSVCTLTSNDSGTTSTVSVGDVAFGVVKSDSISAEGLHTVLTLKSSSKGN